jgi:hypothetical protein
MNKIKRIKLSPNEKITLRWTLFGDKPIYEELLLEVSDKLDILAVARSSPKSEASRRMFIQHAHLFYCF